MNDRPVSPAAERMRATRERRRRGVRLVFLEVRETEIDALVLARWLEPDGRDDPGAIGSALGLLLDRISPEQWRQLEE